MVFYVDDYYWNFFSLYSWAHLSGWLIRRAYRALMPFWFIVWASYLLWPSCSPLVVRENSVTLCLDVMQPYFLSLTNLSAQLFSRRCFGLLWFSALAIDDFLVSVTTICFMLFCGSYLANFVRVVGTRSGKRTSAMAKKKVVAKKASDFQIT